MISLFLILSGLICFGGCHQAITNEEKSTETTTKVVETEPNSIEQTESDYIVRTDWMTFCFSKKDFKEAEIIDIVAEAVSVMADIRSYLGVNYTLEEAEETVCYFDSTYRNAAGEKRSHCFWDQRAMYCTSFDAFVHEYAHMVSENNADLLYHPDKLFSEGLAQYVSWNFYDGIASRQYTFFKEASISQNTSASEHQTVCRLLTDNGLAYNAENYNKAVLAMLDKHYDITKIDKNIDFYIYNVGHIFVDYCINQLGGMETFLSVYCDSVTIVDVYGKTVDELVMEACKYNTSAFYDE